MTHLCINMEQVSRDMNEVSHVMKRLCSGMKRLCSDMNPPSAQYGAGSCRYERGFAQYEAFVHRNERNAAVSVTCLQSSEASLTLDEAPEHRAGDSRPGAETSSALSPKPNE
jgi:hypothetical protein